MICRNLAFLLTLICLGAPAMAADALVAIIIDDMGYDAVLGRRALALDGQLTYSFLPHTPYSRPLAVSAYQDGKEVMVHLPMQPHRTKRPQPGVLTSDMDRAELTETLSRNLRAVPYAVGVNNHMGSQLTADAERMGWVMEAMRGRHEVRYFVDSRTDLATVAEQTARKRGIPATRRNVFLDNRRDSAYIKGQVRQLVRIAKRQGSAVAIGHPHPETLTALAEVLPTLREQGVRLVPVSLVIERQRREKLWRASSSPSQTVARNSKR